MQIARSRALALAALVALAALAAPRAAQAPGPFRAAARIGTPSYGYHQAPSYGHRPPYAVRAAVVGAPRRVWVPGRTVTEVRSVWVPERIERRWVEPVWQVRLDSCGNELRVLLRAGHWSDVCVPGHYEPRTVQVFRPGHWQSVYGR